MSDQSMAERAIVIQVLREDRPARWSRAELEAALCDIPPRSLARALGLLVRVGVLELEAGDVRAAPATRRLDQLGLIAI